MSKKYKSQASSARAAANLNGTFGFGSSFQTKSSALSYVTESPDLSAISEPNVVVAFRNLGKKDSVTKAKALDDLYEYCVSVDVVEQSILTAWAETYPRTSIDNSRRVRQLAHGLQGALTSASGKRIARLLPKVVGPWLAGTFDSDRIVARSAQDALQKSFPSSGKLQALWKNYKDALLDHVEDAMIVQTRQTLSDERTTSPDDAEAKFVRVVGTAMSVLAVMIRNKLILDNTKNLLSERKVWEYVYSSDSYLRRTTSTLLIAACQNLPDDLDWPTISTCFLSKGLHASQVGSSLQFSQALIALTTVRPEIWTKDYAAKTSVAKRLQQFLRQGSQNGSEEVWSNLDTLLTIVPTEAWLAEDRATSIVSIAEAIRHGLNQPSERINISLAWSTYIKICLRLVNGLADEAERGLITKDHLLPIVAQFVTRTEDQQWNLGSRPQVLISTVVTGVIKLGSLSSFNETWSQIVESLIETMRLSLPESSKDFRRSQDAVTAQSLRFFQALEIVFQISIDNESVTSVLKSSTMRLVEEAVGLIKARNGKPYGAAAIIEHAGRCPTFDKSNNTLQRFFACDLPALLDSPSAELLALAAYSNESTSVLEQLLSRQSPNSQEALCSILGRIQPEDLTSSVQQRIEERIKSADQPEATDIASAVMHNSKLADLHRALMEHVQVLLSPSSPREAQRSALDLVEVCLPSSDQASTIPAEYQPSIISRILALAESENELAGRAEDLISRINEDTSSGLGSGSSSEIIIQQQLNGEGTTLSVVTLLELAKALLEKDPTKIDLVFPTDKQWKIALESHLDAARPYSLAISSPLQGALYALRAEHQRNSRPIHDVDGFSQTLRISMYSSKLALMPDTLVNLSQAPLRALQDNFPVAMQLINEKLTVDNANDLWLYSIPEVLEDVASIVSQGNVLLQSWLDDGTFVTHWMGKAHGFEEDLSSTYGWALAWTSIMGQFVDKKGPSQVFQGYEQDLKMAHRSTTLVKSSGLVSVLREYLPSSAPGKKLTNELVASATVPTAELKQLILLNILLDGGTEALETVPAQRLVFLLKNILKIWDHHEEPGFLSECVKLVNAVLPLVADLYGEHWQQILDKLVNIWSIDHGLPLLHASVRLLARVRGLLSSEDVNEDLLSAWENTKSNIEAGLLNSLWSFGTMTSKIDQPRDITADLLRRQLVNVDLTTDVEVFDLLTSPVESIQTAAFAILHRFIPKQQEDLSLELILNDTSVHIPEKLLQLLEDAVGSRQYLLVWHLIFDHFSTASFKLMEAYTADVKHSNHIGRLLSFICEAVHIADNRPVDASKFVIDRFDVQETGPAESEILWLAVHTYYNCLLYLPSLTKDWYLNQKNRIKIPLEAWTTKYISPAIIAKSLAAVREWATSQPLDDDKVLEVKSSTKSSELIASIEIDPENPPISIAVSLSGSYPLESPAVVSRARVGVSEKNWQSWLKTFQIIIFSSGSIIEGLIAFRRNVQGALKGQTECSICYSIIGTDMQTPSKKCGTCKNMFHGACLFRWFKSSNSSSCPLCRNNFNYA